MGEPGVADLGAGEIELEPELEPDLILGPVLGEGGTARVSLAQAAPGREVAVKAPLGPGYAAALEREARALARLEHPNILPLYELRRGPAGEPWLVLRRVRGATWLERMGGMSLEENLSVLRQVAQAAAFAHDQGIVHRDLKPENVMIGAFGEVVVLDWGLAVEAGGAGGPDQGSAQAAGTPGYMAPEMVGDPARLRAAGVALAELPEVGGISPRTDVFLLGAIGWRVLGGAPPFQRSSPAEELAAAWACDLPVLEGPADLLHILRRATRRDPAERFADAGEFLAALDEREVIRAVEAALLRREPEEAADRLRRLSRPAPALEARVIRLRGEIEAERGLRARIDPQTDAILRRTVVLTCSALFAVTPLWVEAAEPADRYPRMIAAEIALGLLIGAALLRLRGRLSQSRVNRDALALFGIVLGAQVILDLGLWRWGDPVAPPEAALVIHLLLLAAISAAGALSVHPRMAGAVSIFLVAFLIASLAPPLAWTVAAMAGALFALGVIRSWALDSAGTRPAIDRLS